MKVFIEAYGEEGLKESELDVPAGTDVRVRAVISKLPTGANMNIRVTFTPSVDPVPSVQVDTCTSCGRPKSTYCSACEAH